MKKLTLVHLIVFGLKKVETVKQYFFYLEITMWEQIIHESLVNEHLVVHVDVYTTAISEQLSSHFSLSIYIYMIQSVVYAVVVIFE
jgi:P2-related tail formation protein